MSTEIHQLCVGCMAPRAPADVFCAQCGWREGTKSESPLYLPPRTLLDNQYMIGRVLGYGGFGITYLGYDTNLARKLAVKEYMPNGVASRASGDLRVTVFRGQSDGEFEYGMQQFLEEGRTVARFQGHTGIVKVIDFVRANDTAYLVMEYLDGCTLETYLQRNNGKLPFGTVLNIMAPVMDALRAVHKESFLHRDISPDNIFVLNSGGVKLIDFGAARFALSQRSKNLSVILKEGYAPPEQYSSKGNQGPWTDVYATAATMYRAISGKIPPPSLDRREADELETPAALGVPLAPEVEAALLRGLAIRVADRFPSMESFQAAITGYPEDYFVDGAERAFQDLMGGATRPISQNRDGDATRRLDPNATRPLRDDERRTPPPPAPPPVPVPLLKNKAVWAGAAAVAILGLVWLLKPKDGGERSAEVVPSGCAYTVSPPMVMIPPAGQQMKVPVGTAAACPWTAATDAPWLSITAASGKGNGELVYTVARNTGQYARTGVINIGGQPHTVQQSADAPQQGACTLSISLPAVTAAAQGGTGSIEVASNCAWSANSDSTWIRITDGPAAAGNGRVSYTVARNDSPVPRTGVIAIAGQVHRISQSGASSTGPGPVADCRFHLNPPAFNAQGPVPNGRVNINTAPNCSWTAQTNAPWISILSSPVGRGPGGLTFTVAANNTPIPRTGAISVGNSTFTVTQPAGAEAPSSDYNGIMKQANAAYRQRNYNLAGQLARQALAMDASKPDAYDLLGHMDLYMAGNLSSAQQNMRAAIARGGKATFIVRHDHSGRTFAQSCTDYLFIWSNKVVFRSPVDPFEVTKAEIKEAEPNKGWLPIPSGKNNFRFQGHVFHIDTRARNYNMTGTSSLNKEEMNLIVALIGKR